MAESVDQMENIIATFVFDPTITRNVLCIIKSNVFEIIGLFELERKLNKIKIKLKIKLNGLIRS